MTWAVSDVKPGEPMVRILPADRRPPSSLELAKWFNSVVEARKIADTNIYLNVAKRRR